MRTLIIWLLLIAALCALAVALADTPGIMQLEWLGWRVTLNTSLFVGVLIVAVAVVAWLSGAITRLWSWPSRKRTQRALLRQQTGLKALTRAAASIAVSDVEGAKKDLSRARRYLNDAPLALLMQAQLHEKQGETGKAAALYHELSSYEETARLGLRGLLATAEKNRDYTRALAIATEGLAQFPNDKALLVHSIELMLRENDIASAEALLARWRTRMRIPREQRMHMLALIGLVKADKSHDSAQRITLLAEAHTRAPWHEQIALRYIECLLDAGDKRLKRVLFRQWYAFPSPALTTLALRWLAHLPDNKRPRSARKLAAQALGHLESHLLLAYDAEVRGELLQAREHADEALAVRESRRALQLIADIEAETTNAEKAQAWYGRAQAAAAEEQWICNSCGLASESWQLFCPSCDACDSQQLILSSQNIMHIEHV